MKPSKINIYNLKHDYWDYIYVTLILALAIIVYYHTTHWVSFIILLLQLLKVRMIFNLFKNRIKIASIDSKSITILGQTFNFCDIKSFEIKINTGKIIENEVDIKVNKTQGVIKIGEYEYYKLTSLLRKYLKFHELKIIDARENSKKDIVKDYGFATLLQSVGLIAIITLIIKANNSYVRFTDTTTAEYGTNVRVFDAIINQLDKFGGQDLVMQFLTCLLLIFTVWFFQKLTIYLSLKNWKRNNLQE